MNVFIGQGGDPAEALDQVKGYPFGFEEIENRRASLLGPIDAQEKVALKELRAAYAQKRLTPRSALKTCDDVIERFPQSLEAEEAEMLIKSILRSNPKLQKEREEQN